jgi:hypothetical protein
MSKTKTMTVTVTRMVQLKQYEPFTVTVAETVELENGDDKLLVRNETYASISKSVTKYINHEISKIADK